MADPFDPEAQLAILTGVKPTTGGGGSTTGPTAGPSTIPALLDVWKSHGFIQVGDKAYNPAWPTGAKGATVPASVYYDPNAKAWSTYAQPMSPGEWEIAQNFASQQGITLPAATVSAGGAAQQPLPTPPAGFHYIPGTDTAISDGPYYNPSKTDPTLTTYAKAWPDPNSPGRWATARAAPGDLQLARTNGAAATTQTTTPPPAAATGNAASVPPAGASPAAAASPAGTQVMSTPGKYPQQFLAPATTNSAEAGTGFINGIYQPHTIQAMYPPQGVQGAQGLPPAPLASPQSAQPINPTGGVGNVAYGPPAPAIQPSASGGLVVNGVTLSPEVVAVVQQAWAASPEAIPQALALVARESGGNPTINNGPEGTGKGYPGGYMNNLYHPDPNDPYHNSWDGGLFGINNTNFPKYGLDPNSVTDPLANAQAAYGLFRASQGFSPWTAGGTIPLPPPANMGSQVTGQVGQSFTEAPRTPGYQNPPNPPWYTENALGGRSPAHPLAFGPALPGINQPESVPPLIGYGVPLRPPGGGILSDVTAATTNPWWAKTGGGLAGGWAGLAKAVAPSGATDTTGAGAPGQIEPGLGPQIYASGPQTYALSHNYTSTANRVADLNGATGFNPEVILRGNHIPSSGNPDTDAIMAASILQKQLANPGAGFADPLAGRAYGTATTFQSPLSGQRENEIRTEAGYAFSPGNVNQGNSLRSPMAGEAPILTPQGISIAGLSGQSPAEQEYRAQQAGLTQLAPTSNPGAVYSAAWGPPIDGLASAANLPNQAQLDAIAAAQNQGTPGGEFTRAFAQGGSFTTPQLTPQEQKLLLAKAAQQDTRADTVPVSMYDQIARAQWGYPMGHTAQGYANGGTFMTTKPTLFPMAGGGTAVTSEYGQPEMVSEMPMRGGRDMMTVTPMHGYAQGGSFTADPNAASDPTQPDAYTQALSTTPEVDRQNQMADQQHARDNVAYQFQRSGVGQPVAVTGQTDPGNLKPGEYFTPTDFTGQIQSAQQKLQGLGPVGDLNALTGQQATLQQQLDSLNAAQTAYLKQKALGGDAQPPADIGALDQQVTQLGATLQQMQTDIANFEKAGNYPMVQTMNAQLAGVQSQLTAAQQARDNAANAQQQGTQAGNLSNGQDVSGQIATLQPQLDQVKTQIGNAQAGQQLIRQIENLRGGQGELSTPAAQSALQPIQAAFSQGTWTPAASDSLVDLGRSLSGTASPETSQLMQDIAGYLKTQRQVPPGLGDAAYTDPTKLAAATKFSI